MSYNASFENEQTNKFKQILIENFKKLRSYGSFSPYNQNYE